MKSFLFKNEKKIIALVVLLVLVVGLWVGAYSTTRRQGEFDLRGRASEIQGTQLLFRGPQKVNVGEKFTVDLLLDTTTDPLYTISGVDAVVTYSFQNPPNPPTPPPSCAPRACAQFVPPADFCKGGTVVMKAPEGPCDCPPPPTCINMKADQTGGGPGGMTYEEYLTRVSDEPRRIPSGGIGLIGVTPGKIFESYPTQVSPVTDGSILPQTPPAPPVQVCGGIAGIACQEGYECLYNGSTRIPFPDAGGSCVPQKTIPIGYGNPITISGVKNYSINDEGSFNGFTGQGVFVSLTFIAQYPGKTTFSLVYKGLSATDDTNINGFLANQPVSLQKPQERLLTAPPAFTVEVVALQPTPTREPTPYLSPTPTTTPPPPPPPAGRLSFTLSDVNGAPVRKAVKIFAKSTDQSEFVLLGQTETNSNGAGEIWIEYMYLSKPWVLYAQTPSHLLRDANVNISPIWFSPGKTVDVKFDKLIPGDIYMAEGQNRQDGIINNFDVAALYAAWVDVSIQTDSEKTGFGALLDPKVTGPADLNADGVVNNRDLAILFSNFGKKSDLQATQ